MRTKFQKHPRIIATFFLLIFFPTLLPNNLFASNNGPVAPEANGFEPIDSSDMVNLSSGDMSYVLPLLNVPSPEGGFPLALSNHSGIAMDQQASWVGLGWSLNPGAINRSVNGYPDDWTKTNVTDFFYDKGSVNDYYNFSIGGTFPNGITLGLGASWGSNRAFGGTVALGYKSMSIAVGNDGQFGLNIEGLGIGSSGITIGVSESISNNFNGSLSYNFSNNQASFGISRELASVKNGSVGMSFSTNGSSSLMSSQGGGSINETLKRGSVNVDVKSDNFGLNLGVFWFGYGHSTVTSFIQEINTNTVSGSLYPYHYKKNEANVIEYKPSDNYDTAPYIRATLKSGYKSDSRFDSGSQYDIKEPYEQGADTGPYERTSDYIINNVDYDNYSVTAQGLSGILAPYISEERLLSKAIHYYDSPNVDYSFDLNQKTNFYFKNSNSSFFRINDGDFRFDGTQSLDNINSIIESINHGRFDGLNRNGSSYGKILTPSGDLIKQGNKIRAGNNIEVFTNNDINSGNLFGFIEAKGINRKTDPTYSDEPLGIGAYRITSLDGKTYHYSLPVYEFETYSKNFKEKTDENKNFLEVKKERQYATHWLLTAVTGSDYYDTNQNGRVDIGDYGYWVEFDYGKWSDGYAWRSPHSGYKEIPDMQGNTNSYSYFWGRKQIFYLDAIRTRTHTALFVKKLRKDDNSTLFQDYVSKINSANEFDRSLKCKQYGSEQFNNPIKKNDNYFLSNGNPYVVSNNILSLKGRQTSFMYVDIPKNYSLCLDKILLLKNEEADNVNKSRGNLINNSIGYIYSGLGYTNVMGANPFPVKLPDLFSNVAVVKSFKGNLHQNILDINDIENLQLEAKSIKTIGFEYNYDLAKNSDNSEDIYKGRLTLKKVSFLGKQGEQVLPSFKFDYFGADVAFNKNEKDVWGYNKTNPEVWSLQKIETPIGTNILIDYEADSYRRQAISERHDEYPFKFVKAYKLFNSYYDKITNVIKNGNNITINIGVPNDKLQKEFLESLYVGSEVYLQYSTGTMYYRDVYEIESFSKISDYFCSVTLKTVDETQSHNYFIDEFYKSDASNANISNNNKLTILKLELPRDSGTDGLGNVNGIKGGGIRVKSITAKEKYSNSVAINEYYYCNPFSKKISGITSYTPFDIYKYVPLIALLPAPGVMYEYVTVKKKGSDGNILLSRLYEFNVLKPNNILVNGGRWREPSNNGESIRFGKYLKIKTNNGANPIVYDPTPTNSSGQNLNMKKIMLNTCKIEDRLSNLGSIKSISDINSENQIIGKQKYYYKKDLDSDGQIGVKENSYYSFNYSGFKTIKIMYTNVIEYPNILEKILTTKNSYEESLLYDKYDFLTGQVTETRTISSDGHSYKTKIVPAYLKYPAMGSKVDNPTNKNMLSQTAAEYSYILDKSSNTWKETGVGITTWSNVWNYKDISGAVSTPSAVNEKVWRKHKTYTWNGVKDANGIFLNYGGNDDNFNWSLPSGVGIDVSQPAQWKQLSETTLYDHFSAPLEMKDINGNKASTKMGDKDTKVMATGNAGYSEMFYAGAENLTTGTNWLEPEVSMTNASRSTSFFHTGKQSVAASLNSQFGVSMQNNQHRAGKYKVSVWVEKSNAAKAQLKVNGTIVSFQSDSNIAGNWQLKTAYVTVPASTCTIYLSSADSSTVYFDDLMIRPMASSITGYVYNEWDELNYIIGNNGLASRFEYDAAGRLVRTYTEVLDDADNGISGGFKLKSVNKINYKNLR